MIDSKAITIHHNWNIIYFWWKFSHLNHKTKLKIMKKLFLVALLAGVASLASAQIKPKSGSNGFMFGVYGTDDIGFSTNNTNPTSGTVLFKHFLSDDNALRLGINFDRESESLKSLSGGDSLKASQSMFGLIVGMQKMLGGTDRLNVYGAADLGLGFGSSKEETTYPDPINNIHTVKSGTRIQFGLTASIGFEYFIAKQWSVGGEFGWGLHLTSQGEGEISDTNPSSNAKGPKSSAFDIGTTGSGMVTMSVYF